MKKFFYILILAAVMALCGCGQSDEIVGTQVDFPDTGDGGKVTGRIFIGAECIPGDEYQGARITVYEAGGTDELAAEIKLRGNSSKESAKKAYTVKFEEEVELFRMDPGRKWALVSNPFDKSLLRPAVGFAYAEALGIDYVPETHICQVWLNDTYMGVYTAMEPVEAGDGRVEIQVAGDEAAGQTGGAAGDFLLERNLGRYEEDKVYLESAGGLRFEFNEPEEPDEAQMAQCYDLLAAAEEAIFSMDHNQYEELIDVDSFVNFYIFHEMIKDVDFGEYSTRYYFKDGVMYAGPPWDLDLTMGNVSTEKDEFKYASYNNVDGAGDESGDSSRGLWAATGDYYYWLCKDPWFRIKVQQRWKAVRDVTENLTADNGLGENVIDEYLEMHWQALESNFVSGDQAAGSDAGIGGAAATYNAELDACWIIDEPAHMSEWQEPASTYAENVEMLRLWLVKRAAYLDTVFGAGAYVTPHEMSDWSAEWQ